MTDTIIICTVFGVFLIVAFILGAKVGQKVSKGEEIKVLPKLPNPIKKIEENREKRESELELERLDIITQNIDNYDGTGAYQQEIPR